MTKYLVHFYVQPRIAPDLIKYVDARFGSGAARHDPQKGRVTVTTTDYDASHHITAYVYKSHYEWHINALNGEVQYDPTEVH
jgi:hypothetical protein